MCRFKRTLVVTALLGAVMMLAGFGLLASQRGPMTTDTGVNRALVEAQLAELQASQSESAGAEDLQFRLEAMVERPQIATVWLFDAQGRLVFSAGSTARFGAGDAEERATGETRRILAELPSDALTAEQRQLVLIASAVQAEGSHNDIYGHLVRPIGSTLGATPLVVGVAYVKSELAGDPGMLWKVLLLVFAVGVVVYWLSLPLWVLCDALETGDRPLLWTVFVFFGNLVGLISYLLSRSSEERGRTVS